MNLTLEEVEKALRENLIDGEYFYSKEWNIQLLNCSHTFYSFTDWYEFEGINFMDVKENTKFDISYLIAKIKTFKNVSYWF